MIVNGIGALFMVIGLIAAFAVGGLVDVIWPNGTNGVMVGFLLFMLIAASSDLAFRWRNFREYGRLRFIHPFTGGMFFFIPIWILFGLAPVVAMPVLAITAPPKKDPPRRASLAPPPPVRPLPQELTWNTANSEKRA